MKSFTPNQAGAAHLVAVFVVLFVGVVSFAGYKVTTMNQLDDPAPVQSAASESVPADISTPADLAKTSAALDNDSALDSGLDDKKLDDDLSDML